MGPPIYIGGNRSPLYPEKPLNPRFNGATDLHRWKLKHWEPN